MITIHALGDSIVTKYGDDANNFIGGWGDHLSCFFDEKNVHVCVYAQGGRSSRSFLNEGRFVDTGKFTENEFPFGMGPAENRIKKGDYVLIQFMHNDDNSKGGQTLIDRMTPLGEPDENGIYPVVVPVESMKVSTHESDEIITNKLVKMGLSQEDIEVNLTKYKEIVSNYGDLYYSYDCGATYKGYLKYYANKIKELGATPVFVTAPARQYYENDKIASIPGHHGGSDQYGDFSYIRAVKQLACEEGITLIDLFEYSVKLLEKLGKPKASYLQSIVGNDDKTLGESRYDRPAQWVDAYNSYRASGEFKRVDDTHQNRLGSYIYAGAIAKEVAEKIQELAPYVLNKASKHMDHPDYIADQLDYIKQTNYLLDI